jgi:hypothetical protein
MRHTSRVVVVLLAFISACGGDDITAPPTGSIEVTTTTTGETSATEYTVGIDGQVDPIGINASLTREGLSGGSHDVLLGGLPEGCTVTGANPLSVTVTAGETAAADFAVTCVPLVGSIRVAVGSVGPAPASYGLVLDGVDHGPIESTAIRTLEAVPAGSHSVGLSAVPANCQLQGQNPQSITVVVGETANLVFAVICTQPQVRWTPMESGSTAFLYDVWGSGPHDVYVVGEESGSFEGVLLHYDGQSWSLVHRSEAGELFGVWASAPNDVFAVGREILHYDGVQWSTMAGPDLPNAVYHAVWGTSGSDVYAVGEYFEPFNSDNLLVAHYDGITWSAVDVGERPHQFGTDVHGTSGSDVYVTGYVFPGDGSFALHYNGTSWDHALTGGGLLNSVWANAPDDVFASGYDGQSGFIQHYDGQNWTQTTLSRLRVRGLWGASASDVYAAGDEGIFHFDGNAWSTVFDQEVAAVWGASATDVFAVGAGGLIVHGTP